MKNSPPSQERKGLLFGGNNGRTDTGVRRSTPPAGAKKKRGCWLCIFCSFSPSLPLPSPSLLPYISMPPKKKAVEVADKSIDDMTVAELKEELKAQGLEVNGKKADLLARLKEHYSTSSTAEEGM